MEKKQWSENDFKRTLPKPAYLETSKSKKHNDRNLLSVARSAYWLAKTNISTATCSAAQSRANFL